MVSRDLPARHRAERKIGWLATQEPFKNGTLRLEESEEDTTEIDEVLEKTINID